MDVTPITSAPNRDSLLQALRRQFDIVADLGLSGEIQQFFRSIPFVIDTVSFADPMFRGAFAAYCAGPGCKFLPQGATSRIRIVPRVFAVDDPVFLHELLHAFHDQRLPEGNGNPDVDRFYQTARAEHVWPENAYTLQNPREFFAGTASAYLFGRAGSRGTVSRQIIKDRLPAYYQWLATVFGPP